MDNQNEANEAPKSSGLFSGQPVAEPPVPQPEAAIEAPKVNEREVLMSRARLLGVEFSNNIGTETLRERINAKLDGLEEAVEEPKEAVPETNAFTGESSNAPVKSFRQALHDEQMRLIRVRITCMDPKKKDLHGEVFTIANEYLGTVRKFVPFGEVTEEGFHIPFCIYTMMNERQFLNIRTVKDRRTGSPRVESNYAKEFSMDVLPALTADELSRLATAQAAAGSVD